MMTYAADLTEECRNRRPCALKKSEEGSKRIVGRCESAIAMDALGEDYEPVTKGTKSASAAEPKKEEKVVQVKKDEEK